MACADVLRPGHKEKKNQRILWLVQTAYGLGTSNDWFDIHATFNSFKI